VARSSKRQSLRDARQFTPNHNMDETYGRLSPRKVFRNARKESYDRIDLRSNQRLDWPDDPPKLPLDEARLPMQMESELQGRTKPSRRETESNNETDCAKRTIHTAGTIMDRPLHRAIMTRSRIGHQTHAPLAQLHFPEHTQTRLSISKKRLHGMMMGHLT
jgi:hypothetical protein